MIFKSLFLGIIFYKFLIENNEQKGSKKFKVENRLYYNKSFGFNYLDMCQKEFLMKNNRKPPNFNSNILVTLIIIYPNPFETILRLNLSDYINILSKEIQFNFSLALITCNNDISNLLISNSS